MVPLHKLLIITVTIVIATCAPVKENENEVTLKKYEFKQLNDKNQYSFEYKTSDGQERNEVGNFKTDENGDTKYSVDGSYSYTGPDGKFYYVWYTADENGFHPNGFHLPGATALPIAPQLNSNAIKSLIG